MNMDRHLLEQEFLDFLRPNNPRLIAVGVEQKVKLATPETQNQDEIYFPPTQKTLDLSLRQLNHLITYVESGEFQGDSPQEFSTQEIKEIAEDLERVKAWLLRRAN